jgi:hypothetical protein
MLDVFIVAPSMCDFFYFIFYIIFDYIIKKIIK